MTVLGVITCEVLELEFAHLLAGDSQVTQITVLDDDFSSCLVEALVSEGRKPEKIADLSFFNQNKSDGLDVLIRVLELGLHNRKGTLQKGLVQSAKEMGEKVDGIVLGYGLCGNALEKPDELLADAGVPVFIPMDRDHPVDDCVGLLIGGRECYYGELCRVAGTFFMIPGWTRHWKGMLTKEFGEFDAKTIKRILGMSNYERSLIIPNPVLSEKQMRENIEEFNRLFNFRTEVRQGTLAILNNTWESAKNHLLTSTS
jgi:hypothetical protein